MTKQHQQMVDNFKTKFLTMTVENRTKQVELMQSRSINTNEIEKQIASDILNWAKDNINK